MKRFMKSARSEGEDSLVAHKRHALTRLAGVVGIAALAVILVACSAGAPTPASGTVNSVTIDQGSSDTVTVGQTLSLSATVDATGGTATTVNWSSGNTSVATVDSSGTVTGVSVGSATITATSTADSTKSDSIDITVSGSTTVDPQNIYVNASAPAGGDGSSANPFQTIAAGAQAVASGGTVHVAAGTYDEALGFGATNYAAFTLQGAGEGQTIIAPTSNVGSSTVAMAVNRSGVTLSGFTLDVQTGSSTEGIDAGSAATGFTLSHVTIDLPGTNDANGVVLYGANTSTVDSVTVTDNDGGSGGAGVVVANGVSGATLNDVTTTGFGNGAGILLDATSSALSNIAITSVTLNQINKLEVNHGSGGSLTGLDAPQFTDAVRNTDSFYASGNYWFYKTSESDAVRDSLFNFPNATDTGSVYTSSFIQRVSGSDQATLGDFVVGQYTSGSTTRSNSIATAIAAASAGDTIHVLSGTFTGAFTVDKALTITGAGSTSKIEAASGAVITVTGDPVEIDHVDVNDNDNGSAAITFDATQVPGLVINNTNLTSNIAIHDSASSPATSPVNAQSNWWGQTNGPRTGQLTGTNASVDIDTSNALQGSIN